MVGFGEVWASDDDFAFLDEPTDDVRTKDANVETKQSGSIWMVIMYVQFELNNKLQKKRADPVSVFILRF